MTNTPTGSSKSTGSDVVARKKVTVPGLLARKGGDPIAMITAYDATFAKLVDEAGIDVILVGDSVGMVVQGTYNTIPVDMDEMAYHVRVVARANPKAHIVGDLPFGSYQVSSEQAVGNAIRLMKEGAESVKLEGGVSMASTIEAITRIDVPVMAHIGLTPQSYHRMGGHRVQGRESGFDPGGRERLLEDAHAVEQAGAFAVVVEGVPMDLAEEITHKLSIPTIGIGAGVHCDGQVLVLHDILGLSDRTFTFAKKYADLRSMTVAATREYIAEVRDHSWPDTAHSFT
jgi:3-methyl-2-oxobutanoate hydroxymethyltransferase